MTTAKDIASMTPIEIDTEIAKISAAIGKAMESRLKAQTSVHQAAGDRQIREGRGIPPRWGMSLDQAEQKAQELASGTDYQAAPARRALVDLDAARLAETSAYEALLPWNAEFTRRGGWTRSFLVTDGHAHSSQDCSTCNRQGQLTNFSWMVAYSGLNEAEIVKDAGERACTVCYPSAPVDDLKRPSKMFTPEEIDRQQKREEAEAAKTKRAAAKAAKAIANPDGTELKVFNHHWPERQVRQGNEIKVIPAHDDFTTLETLHSARGWITDWYGEAARGGHPSYREDDRQRVAEAIAHKEGKTREEALAEAQARAKRRK